MNRHSIPETINELTRQIAVCQDALKLLFIINGDVPHGTMNGSEAPGMGTASAAPAARASRRMADTVKPKRTFTKRANNPSAVRIPPGEKRKAEPKPISSVASVLDKPTTVGGAMKFVARQLKTFTQEELLMALEADRDFAKLLAESSGSAVRFNLNYWSDKSGQLTRKIEGDRETFTVVEL